jgi:hypothetical protein
LSRQGRTGSRKHRSARANHRTQQGEHGNPRARFQTLSWEQTQE